MRLCRQMHDCMGLKAFKYSADGCLIGNIGLDEFIAGIGRDTAQRLEVTGVGQLVEVEDFVLGGTDQVANQGRADKTGTAGYEYAHVQ
ncbi:hypothetical protein D3C77_419620 [compost metagenome]